MTKASRFSGVEALSAPSGALTSFRETAYTGSNPVTSTKSYGGVAQRESSRLKSNATPFSGRVAFFRQRFFGGGIRLCLNPCLSGEDRGAERKGPRGATRSHAQRRRREHGEDCEHGAKRSLVAPLGAAPPALLSRMSARQGWPFPQA